MASVTERLFKLKNELEQAKLDKATIEGALNQNTQRLKDEFSCRSVEQGKAKLKKLSEQKEDLEKKIEKAVKKLEEAYSW